MSFKLVISAALVIAVKGSIQEGGVQAPFSFSLLADRLPSDKLQELFDRSGGRYTDMVIEVATGWRDVLGEDGQPTDFSPEALRALLNTHGLARLCWDAYNEACSVKGKEKN